MIIGYARVSKDDQNLGRQIDQLKNFGAEKIIQEKYTGIKRNRPGIEQLLQTIRKGVVESISRLGRNTLDILNLIQELDQKQIQFVSLKENMNTSTPTGRPCYK